MEADTTKNSPLFKMAAKLADDHVVEFSQLSFGDISEISTFLRSVWSKGYGRMGSPDFSEDYLRWVLGGPNKSKNLLFGGRINNELVAYQSFLFRTMDYCGKKLSCYLNTHLAASMKIDLRARLECLFEIEQQCVLLDERSKYYDPNCDLIFAFFEAGKPLKYREDRLLRKCLGITRLDYATFNQFMILPRRLRTYLNQNRLEDGSILLRGASESDSNELSKLFNDMPDNPHFTRIMTVEELRHHFCGHPNHFTSVIETEGRIEAFINFYPMEIIKEGQTSSYVIIEFLFSKERNRRFIAMLLNEALRVSEKMGAKGVVVENGADLDFDYYREIGVIPTFRKMTMSVISKNYSVDHFGSFRCDIK